MNHFIGCLLFLVSMPVLAEGVFRTQDLPVGKSITILPSMPAALDLNSKIVISSTDSPQTLKFESKNVLGMTKIAIKFSISDRKKSITKKIEVKSGQVFLYTFQKLDSLVVTPDVPRGKNAWQDLSSNFLQVQSDRPLTLAREM